MRILITGGASGLGEAITKTLVMNENNIVYFTYCNSEIKSKQLEAKYKNTIAIYCDFSNQISIDNLTENLAKYDLDVIIHNAYSGQYLKTHFPEIAG